MEEARRRNPHDIHLELISDQRRPDLTSAIVALMVVDLIRRRDPVLGIDQPDRVADHVTSSRNYGVYQAFCELLPPFPLEGHIVRVPPSILENVVDPTLLNKAELLWQASRGEKSSQNGCGNEVAVE